MTVRSLTVPMKAEGLTSFKIQYDYRTDQFKTAFMKEWEPDFDWSRYNKEFYDGSLMTDEVKYYNTVQTRELFAKYGLEDYLDQVEDLIRQGKHYGIEGYYHEGYDILFMSHQHSRKVGINNRYQATLAGGIRRHNKSEEEVEVIIDGLNLGRGMTYKDIAANINMGGCKQTVTMDPIDLTNLQHVGFLGFCIDRCPHHDRTGHELPDRAGRRGERELFHAVHQRTEVFCPRRDWKTDSLRRYMSL